MLGDNSLIFAFFTLSVLVNSANVMLRSFFLLILLSCLTLAATFTSAQAPAPAGKPKVSTTLLVRKPGAWKPLDSGIEHRIITLERSDPSYSFDLNLVRFGRNRVFPRIISSGQFQLKSADAKTLGQRSGAVVTINANYFDEKGKPLAFLKTATGEINRNVSKHALYTGVFGVRDSIPFIVHRDDFQLTQAQEAIQSGPLLLKQGAAMENIPGAGRYSRRAVIGIDKQQRLIVGVTDTVLGGLSFPELQELFSRAEWQLETTELLNLDGGGSAQLYIRTRSHEEFISGTSEVPVVIGFFKTAN
ncbi:MAG TPA: phosphodiester glycosidase family protein [Candidatus Binatia bacterium]